MGQEFLTDSNAPQKTYTEVFYEQLPFYLAIGMSLTEYFDGDSMLARYFRQAYQVKQEQDDYSAWLQAVYIYKAIDCALYNNPPLMKRGREARKFYDKPFMQADKQPVEETLEEKALRQEQEEAAMGVWLENFVNLFKNVNNESA